MRPFIKTVNLGFGPVNDIADFLIRLVKVKGLSSLRSFVVGATGALERPPLEGLKMLSKRKLFDILELVNFASDF
jgi:hypothetical protein